VGECGRGPTTLLAAALYWGVEQVKILTRGRQVVVEMVLQVDKSIRNRVLKSRPVKGGGEPESVKVLALT